MGYILYGLLIVLIIIVIVFIAYLVRRLSVWGPQKLTYYQKCARDAFSEVTGDQWQTKNQEVIAQTTSVPDEKRNAFDHFIVGATYMYGRRYPKKIASNYRRALEEIQRGNVFEDERDFILERIRDHVQFHPEPFGEEELDELQEPLLEIFEQVRAGDLEVRVPGIQQALHADIQQRREERNYNAENEKRRADRVKASSTKAERIENLKPVIRSDAENVHSSACTHEFAKQFKRLRIYNDRDARSLPPQILDDEREADRTEIKTGLLTIDQKREEELNKTAYNEALVWMGANYGKTHPDFWDELKRRFVNDFSIVDTTEGGKNKIAERDVIAHVWRRIHSPVNVERSEDLREMLTTQLGECIQSGKSVCTTGRTENIHATLATHDADPKMGILKTDEVIKQEVYTAGSKIIAEEVAKLSTDEQEKYNKNAASELPADKLANVQMMVTNCHTRIDRELPAKFGSKLVDSTMKILVADIKRECDI